MPPHEGDTPVSPAMSDTSAKLELNRVSRWWRSRWLLVAASLLVAFGLLREQVWPPVFQTLARRALERHDPAIATSWLKVADWFSIQSPETALLRARAARVAGRSADIAAALLDAEQRGADPRRIRREQILCLAQSGNLAQAGPFLSELLTDTSGDNRDVCLAYVSGYLRSQRLGEAIALLDPLILDAPDDPVPLVTRGRVRLLQSDFPAAESDLRAALVIDAAHEEAQILLAELLRDTRRLDDAEELFRTLLNSETYRARAAIGLSECLKAGGKFAEAEQLLTQAVALDAANGPARTELGRMQLENGRAQEAVTTLNSAVELRPWSDDAHYLLAQALTAAGRKDEAAEHFTFVDEARRGHSELNRLSDEIAKSPQDVTLLIRTAELLSSFGDPQEAIAVCQSALSLDPTNAKAHGMLAELLDKQASIQPELKAIAELHRKQAAASSSTDNR